MDMIEKMARAHGPEIWEIFDKPPANDLDAAQKLAAKRNLLARMSAALEALHAARGQ